MNKLFVISSLILLSCLEFESPYEDMNGIYLQWISSFNEFGDKIIINGGICYLMRSSSLMLYDMPQPDIIDYRTYYYPTNYYIKDFEIANEYAYLAISSYGLEIVNCQGSDPFLYGKLKITDGADIIKLYKNYVYLSSANKLYIIDVSNKTNPQKKGEFDFNNNVKCLKVDTDYAYVLLNNSDFCILDIKKPSEPSLISHTVHPGSFAEIVMFTLNENYLYFLTNDNRIDIYEITDSYYIDFVSRMYFPDGVSFICTGDKYGLGFSGHTVYLLNIDYPSQPCVSEIINLPGNPPDYGIIMGNYLYILTPYLNIIEIKEIPQ